MHNATTTDQLFRRCRDPLSCAWRLAAATAYYLAKNHGITNVAVLEAGWIGGGNTGRNTTIVRSNYLYPESARLYDFSVQQYEQLAQELNFNIMFSQRG
jgi:sarcosine oxidase subunit beta